MLTLTTALSEMISADSFLQHGLQYRLFNLTQLSHHIVKHLEARTKKSLSVSAVLMALSRYQRRLKKFAPALKHFAIQDLSLRTHVAIVSISKTAKNIRQVHTFHTQVHAKNGYITITESTNEITMIFDVVHLPLAKKILGDNINSLNANVAGLALRSSAEYASAPGFLCAVLQQMMLQGINVIEVASTYTEFVLYVDECNAKLAFDTLYVLFRVPKT